MLHRLMPILVLGAALTACQYSREVDAIAKAVDLHLENALIYFDGGHYRSAIAQANKVLSLKPKNTKARHVRAQAMLKIDEPERVQQACGEFEHLVNEDFGEHQYKVWIGLAMARASVGNLYDRRARKLADEMKRSPLCIRDVTPRREEALKKMREFWRDSNVACRKVLGFEDIPEARNDPTALYYLYRNHSRLEEHETALEYAVRYLGVIETSKRTWEECLVKFPNHEYIYAPKLKGAREREIALLGAMANTYYKLNRLVQAEETNSRLIMLDPLNLKAYVNRAQVNRKKGRHDLAVADLKEFLKKTRLDETDPRALEVVDLLRDSQAKMAED